MGHLVPLLRGQAPHQRDQLADGHAVAEQGDGLVRMPGGQTARRLPHPGAQLVEALSVGGTPGGVGGIEPVQLLRPAAADIPEGQILPIPQVHLPQAGVGVQGEIFRDVHRPGGGHGAVQVAGINRVHTLFGKAPLQRRNLAAAVGGDQAVIPAVGPTVQVALCLRVADDIKSRHKICVSLSILLYNRSAVL